MIFLGHIGIGKRMAKPWSAKLPVGWLVLGTVLPDLIDKPLYYAFVAITGRSGADLGLISGTRTVGHTFLLVGLIGIFAWRGSPKAKALVLGLLTHFVLDFIGDLFDPMRSSTLLAAFFPLLGAHFYALPFHSMKDHLAAKLNPYALGGEVVGALLLFQDWRRKKRQLPAKRPQISKK